MALQNIGPMNDANMSSGNESHGLRKLTLMSLSSSDLWIGNTADNIWTMSTTTMLLLAWVGSMYVIHSIRKHYHKQALAKQFEDFLVDNKCSRTTRSIPYGFIPSWSNKLRLLFDRSPDLLGQTFGERFGKLGATHGLYDGYGLPKTIHTIDPSNTHAVLSTKSQDFSVPKARLIAIGPVKSKGVVVTEGQVWSQNRKIINVGFRGARYTEDIEKNLRMFFGSLAAVKADGWTKPFPLFDTMAFMSLDRSIRHMFGVKADLQSESGEAMKQRRRWKEAFDIIASFVAVRSVLGTKSWMYDGLSFRNACGLLRELCRDVIEIAIKDSKAGIANDASFVGNLVQESSDAQRICDVTLDVFIAGHNMTAGVLTWLFLELEQHPSVYDEVREEVLEMFGTETQPKAEMSWDNLQKCKKLHDCIYEAMRLHPTLPNIGRQAIRDTILPTGGGEDGKQPVAVAKGTVVMCCLYLMHRRSEEWGSEPNEYNPQRWNERESGYEYSPFGGGPRICPGKMFALVEMYYATARIMQRYKAIKQADDRVSVRVSGAGVLIPPDGVRLSVQVVE